MGETLGCLTGALPDSGDALLGSLPDTLEGLIGAFADLTHSLAGPFTDLADRLPGPLADVFDRALSAFADVLDRLAGFTDEMPSSFTNLFGSVADAFEQLGVAIERGQHALEDQADVVEPRLEQGLGLDALDLQLHFAEADIGADADLHQIAHLCDHRYLCPQVIDLDVDLVDLDDGDVEKDVGAVGKLARIDD